MKTIIKCLLVLILFLCVAGCHRERWLGYTAYYQNDSGVDITVITDSESISIPRGEVYSEKDGYIGGVSFYPFHSLVITVIFNGDRAVSYSYKEEDITLLNNPCVPSNYETTKRVIDKYTTEYEFRYSFVPEQYEMAEPYDPDAQQEED